MCSSSRWTTESLKLGGQKELASKGSQQETLQNPHVLEGMKNLEKLWEALRSFLRDQKPHSNRRCHWRRLSVNAPSSLPSIPVLFCLLSILEQKPWKWPAPPCASPQVLCHCFTPRQSEPHNNNFVVPTNPWAVKRLIQFIYFFKSMPKEDVRTVGRTNWKLVLSLNWISNEFHIHSSFC